jgi:hypothetical protein
VLLLFLSQRLMTVSGPYIHEPALPSCDKSSSSPHKRRRLSEDADGEGVPSGSVEDILWRICGGFDEVSLMRTIKGTSLVQFTAFDLAYLLDWFVNIKLGLSFFIKFLIDWGL